MCACLFVCARAHLFAYLFACLFVRSLARPFVRLLVRLVVCVLACLFYLVASCHVILCCFLPPSFAHSFVPPFVRLGI